MRILLSHPNSVAHHNSRHRDDLVVHHQHAAFPKRMSVVQEGVVSATTTTTTTTTASSSPSSSSSPLVSCRKESSESMTSWASISSTETTESDSGFSLGRRQIFSEYWKTNTPVVLDLQQQQQDEEEAEAEEQNHPRSPLIQHYPTRNYSESPTSTMQEQEPKQLLSVSPCRRSIFGSSRRSNNNISYMYNRQVDLDGFFSTHTHMKVLSSSTLDSTMSSDNTALVRRPRSFSCSDEPLRKGPLTSCLKRGNSNSDCHNTSTSTTTVSTIGSSSSSSTNNNDAATLPMLRRPSVTFDSQIEIIAFERINSYDGEPSCMDGSWTNQFER